MKANIPWLTTDMKTHEKDMISFSFFLCAFMSFVGHGTKKQIIIAIYHTKKKTFLKSIPEDTKKNQSKIQSNQGIWLY